MKSHRAFSFRVFASSNCIQVHALPGLWVPWLIFAVAILALPLETMADEASDAQFVVALNLTNSAAPHANQTYLLPYHVESSPQKYFEWLWKDAVNFVTRPVYWRNKEWTTFAIEGGITGALLPLDDSVRDVIQDNPSNTRDSVLNNTHDITGGGNYYFAAGGALFGSGLIVRNEKLADSGFLALESIAYAGRLADGIKYLTGRDRPDTGKDQYQFHGPSGPSNSAFVSREATVAFAFASSISEVWHNPWVTWPSYIFAGAVAAQRVNSNRHWLSDVVGGAFLGHAVGKTFVHFHYRQDGEGRLQPYITPDTVGMQVVFLF